MEEPVLHGLRQIKSLGLRIGVISNCSVEEVEAWAACPLAPLLDEVVFSYQVGHVKPDPEFYLLACQRLGVSPDRALFVGDGGSDELRGATEVGMKAYAASWFVNRWPDHLRKVAEPATIGYGKVADFRDLLTILGDLTSAKIAGEVAN